MRQATMVQPGRIQFRDDIEVPAPGDDEILLRVSHIGVCGSDIHVNHGKHPFTSYPVIQGHEFSAEIVAVGAKVDAEKFPIGTFATALPQVFCGECDPCRRGDFNICDALKVRGFQVPGVAQDYVTFPQDMVIPLPQTMSAEIGALIEPLAVAVHSVSRAGPLSGKNVLVTGAGTIGNLIAQVAQARGGNVLISDVSDYRLEKVRECGIAKVVNPKTSDIADVVEQVFGPSRFDVAFEVAGVESALDTTVQLVAKGGTIVAVAVYGDRPKIDMAVLGDREIVLKGTLMYKHEDYLGAIELIRQEKVRLSPLVSVRFPFDDYMQAYEYIDQNPDKTMKAMIVL
ncbi:2-desacetyl-2-hydroxyethyl bacteriochlorophyllide A dehydrogenase [Rhodobium orientis]|uniref:Zn-dependent alcohol dehydrogenase n=1 Tax=Rhodobium orientis TaxID=34017 RepID=A0A327JM17_9HYPH|nr:alcohol dehydrogenase catalytic domain-containing protein [Rhodobium orientis]MBB4304560.1 2-desacetyl-2-hydroxyethyl bacteriochlorophyllide A dehydrogenase [Rhodobium orientis]MBK5951405.1 Zn-dependent alcohol dehydrogenase [Rhodobium orientis]RAI27520.1 Zn-dependent alcohol dehydrogenase [Rhodobium orientis]